MRRQSTAAGRTGLNRPQEPLLFSLSVTRKAALAADAPLNLSQLSPHGLLPFLSDRLLALFFLLKTSIAVEGLIRKTPALPRIPLLYRVISITREKPLPLAVEP
jgi:hypothetical protein